MIVRQGKRYNVYDKTGTKLLGSHASKAEAAAQLAAIEISKAKRAKHG